jgi:hypothetical protein
MISDRHQSRQSAALRDSNSRWRPKLSAITRLRSAQSIRLWTEGGFPDRFCNCVSSSIDFRDAIRDNFRLADKESEEVLKELRMQNS